MKILKKYNIQQQIPEPKFKLKGNKAQKKQTKQNVFCFGNKRDLEMEPHIGVSIDTNNLSVTKSEAQPNPLKIFFF